MDVLLRSGAATPLMDGMTSEVIYNQLVREFADDGLTPFDEIALDPIAV
jgi:hypothetical protein